MTAAQKLMGLTVPLDVPVILRASQNESVPQIRQLLDRLIADTGSPNPTKHAGAAPQATDHSSGADIGALITHELAPAIGRVTFEASLEIADFGASQTALALGKLEARVLGLSRIATSGRDRLDFTLFNLIELVQASVPEWASIELTASPSDGADEDFQILSDRDVFGLLLASALTNAAEANAEVDPTVPLAIEIERTGVSFIVTVSNHFAGTQLSRDQVISAGRSTKHGSRGTGMRVIQTAADRLGCSWTLDGTAGIATFVLRCGLEP